MGEPFDTLLDVQHHDTVIDQLNHRREVLPSRLQLRGVEDELAELEGRIAELRAAVDELAGRQRALEEQITASVARRHEIERRMLAPGVSASRDLQAMDAEVHHLAERQAQLEEVELELVAEEDPLDEALAAAEERASALRGEAERLAAVVAVDDQEITAELERERQLRSGKAAMLPVDLATRYEALRARLGGVGAARLVEGRCDGCHLALPSVEVERISRLPADEYATCEQCGRILVADHR
ncbi:MAG: C4-type zinc ribbon domain-containing protein [Actinomycetota bacterium]|jgi:hypothetical protein|nr:C4-type zinc ribbon domain-containing protein [Actinomycetota bacterium]MDA8340830.1 C4-type zinc ribbon domain-containing protein [Actinomycetota bacterium]